MNKPHQAKILTADILIIQGSIYSALHACCTKFGSVSINKTLTVTLKIKVSSVFQLSTFGDVLSFIYSGY